MDYNENMVIDKWDAAILAPTVGAVKGDANYQRRFDLDFDNTIEASDLAELQSRLGLDLVQIIGKLDKRQSVFLDWGDGFTAYLCAVDPKEVRLFTSSEWYIDIDGWITIYLHPYVSSNPQYVCRHFAADTAIAAYKALGYGRLFVAYSLTHAYIVFWTGEGDWYDFQNWKILEPQNGALYDILPYGKMPSAFQTQTVYFYKQAMEPYFNEGVWKQNIFAKCMCMDSTQPAFPAGRLTIGGDCPCWALGGWLEELAPVGDFDTRLGVWWA